MTAAFTVGYGGRPPAAFARLLTGAGVRTVVDVRLHPYKASMGSYALAADPAKGIAGLLGRSGIGYVSLPELGNPFVYTADWPGLYPVYLERVGELLFRRLPDDLLGPLALLCAEKRVADCHRRHVAGWLTAHRGWTFTHIQ